MKNRALLFVAVFGALLLIPLIAPAAALAGTCPSDSGGVLEKTTYRVGERLDFYGTYTDFAAAGTTTIDFTRPADGATRHEKASNLADGEWIATVIFSSPSDVGAWNVRVVVTQNSGTSVCDDHFTLIPASGPTPRPTPPSTSTVAGPTTATGPAPTLPIGLGGIGLIAFAAVLGWSSNRRRANRAG